MDSKQAVPLFRLFKLRRPRVSKVACAVSWLHLSSSRSDCVLSQQRSENVELSTFGVKSVISGASPELNGGAFLTKQKRPFPGKEKAFSKTIVSATKDSLKHFFNYFF